jgi:hypothetical protein
VGVGALSRGLAGLPVCAGLGAEKATKGFLEEVVPKLSLKRLHSERLGPLDTEKRPISAFTLTTIILVPTKPSWPLDKQI